MIVHTRSLTAVEDSIFKFSPADSHLSSSTNDFPAMSRAKRCIILIEPSSLDEDLCSKIMDAIANELTVWITRVIGSRSHAVHRRTYALAQHAIVVPLLMIVESSAMSPFTSQINFKAAIRLADCPGTKNDLLKLLEVSCIKVIHD